MDARVRRLLTFSCEGAELGATLDGEGAGATGLLFVTGGTQTRIGSHRLFERLAAALAAEGIPCFRFDRRGVGDSGGADPGWRGSAPDLAAATAAFRSASPRLERVLGIGLCDGATALALFGGEAGLAGAILLNPWLVEAEPGEPPPAAIKHHYQTRLSSLLGWRKILAGSVSWTKVLKGVGKIFSGSDSSLGDEVAAALAASRFPVEAILATDDGTGIAARHALARPAFAGALRRPPLLLETSSHTFARPGDPQRLLHAVRESLARFEPQTWSAIG
ncbi:hydrolase 1, exosortase A system-associated [Sphingomonas parva]|uniref:Hydrolase 1, exosortase A system-associated n=1 Tax=Sphingomonas parva TaxID=2555898 RepID=A0A4Y8ZQ93_9SPHN|nr:hydrolase 1, exosortase A system-associated [Sphingomonas parva]TFI58181.1 hydrolase 1, exosortase A system-associated [Sphingomonas parva]